MKAKAIKKLDPQRSLAENSARIIRVRLDEMRSFVPTALAFEAVDAQHDMRIAAKRVRYILEATDFCFGSAGSAARRRAKELQDVLGELHDCDVMLPRVETHIADLRGADAAAVRAKAADAADLDPALAARAPHRTAYRGLEVLAVYVAARRRLLFDRFRETWADQQRGGVWDRLERAAKATLEDERERRRAAEQALQAARDLEAAERAEREAAARARSAAEELRIARQRAAPIPPQTRAG